MYRTLPALFAALAISAGAAPDVAPAATVTFNHGAGLYTDLDNDGFDDLYIEDGISVTGFKFGELTDYPKERGHLDNPSDGHFTDRLSFTMGGLFDLQSFEIFPLGYECLDEPCAGYDNVVVTGFRRGLKVAEHIFSMGTSPSTYVGGALFTGLDRLDIWTPPEPFEYTFGNSHFEIDNLILAEAPAPVPVPPALPLLGAGLLGLWMLRRRRTRI